VIGDPGDQLHDSPANGASSADAAPIVGNLVEAPEELPPVAGDPAAAGDRPTALPLVRKLAKQLGVDLAQVVPTGPNGRVRREDVEAAARADRATPAAVGSAVQSAPVDEIRRPLSRIRRITAANMVRSWTEIPQVTAFDEVDATRLLAVRSALQRRHDRRIPLDALLVAAVVQALQTVPVFSARLDGDDLVLPVHPSIGVAVDAPDGLFVAVIRNADERTTLGIADEIERLQERARSGSLSAAEVTGQHFTVSNIGAVNGSWGTPLVPPGTAGILSAGRAREKPVARDGRVEIAPVMPLSFSFDHRIADGGEGRRFLGLVVENLAEPALFLA
jgi:pyruvate dehydrogenase E2 component (dihydrolipoamide acetyltransferase)